MNTPTYDHRDIENRWQRWWAEESVFATPKDRSRPKYYVLDMFPYPSGEGLHVGHPKSYVATDVIARARRMMGYNVLRVMGWDAFGLPAERQATREGVHPRTVTERNANRFRSQLQRLGLCYDWDAEISTCEPEYYRWTQWIFLRLLDAGLAYESMSPVNWCPRLKVVLANEEVKDGRYVETGDPVERRRMRQWMLRITRYAEQLLEGLDCLDWPKGIIDQQRAWIGRSEGTILEFRIKGSTDSLPVFTTRADTIFGATYVALAPDGESLRQLRLGDQQASVSAFVGSTKAASDRSRLIAASDPTGVDTGCVAINPVTGKELPIWVADYVLGDYGSGAVFGCPAHSAPDFRFAKRYGLDIVCVVDGAGAELPYEGDGAHVNSGFLNGLGNADAVARIQDWLEQRALGRPAINYRLRDWLFSRQRYWGEPIPVLHDAAGVARGVDEEELPVELPHLEDFQPTPDGRPPLARAADWVNVPADSEGEALTRETNTMPQWAGSCWYYLRYVSPHLTTRPWSRADEEYWLPVDLYVGGAEHATLHLLYARFWHRFLYDIGEVSTKEPFSKLFNQGMIHARSFRDAKGKYHYPREVEQRGEDWYHRESGELMETRIEKMSKSRYNTVSPDDICEQYGADSLRVYELFMGPLEDGGIWNSDGVIGARRFLERLWRAFAGSSDDMHFVDVCEEHEDEPSLVAAMDGLVSAMSDAVKNSMKFNTCISDFMVLARILVNQSRVSRSLALSVVKLLNPLAPHLAEELWLRLEGPGLLSDATWPMPSGEDHAPQRLSIGVQVNGRLRGDISVDVQASKEDAVRAARAQASVEKWLIDQEIVKVVYVPSRILNFVTRGV
jgi:leucyl-tRNA synthetase